MFCLYIRVLALNRYSKPFLALLGDRFSYSYFPFNKLEIEVLANRTKVTYRASLGKPIVPIEKPLWGGNNKVCMYCSSSTALLTVKTFPKNSLIMILSFILNI